MKKKHTDSTFENLYGSGDYVTDEDIDRINTLASQLECKENSILIRECACGDPGTDGETKVIIHGQDELCGQAVRRKKPGEPRTFLRRSYVAYLTGRDNMNNGPLLEATLDESTNDNSYLFLAPMAGFAQSGDVLADGYQLAPFELFGVFVEIDNKETDKTVTVDMEVNASILHALVKEMKTSGIGNDSMTWHPNLDEFRMSSTHLDYSGPRSEQIFWITRKDLDGQYVRTSVLCESSVDGESTEDPILDVGSVTYATDLRTGARPVPGGTGIGTLVSVEIKGKTGKYGARAQLITTANLAYFKNRIAARLRASRKK